MFYRSLLLSILLHFVAVSSPIDVASPERSERFVMSKNGRTLLFVGGASHEKLLRHVTSSEEIDLARADPHPVHWRRRRVIERVRSTATTVGDSKRRVRRFAYRPFFAHYWNRKPQRPNTGSSNTNTASNVNNNNNININNNNNNNGRFNKTCVKRITYECEKVVKVAYYDWCVYRFFRCLRYRHERINKTCQQDIRVCCDGYSLAPSGLCEKTEDWGCGSPWLLTETQGVIKSPGYPKHYRDDLKCRWRVQGPPNTRIVMKVVDLDLETPIDACNLDYGDCYDLCLFDVAKITDYRRNHTRSLCGQLGPTEPQVTSGNRVDVQFESDGSRSGRGIMLVYSAISTSQLSPRYRCSGGRMWKLCRRVCVVTCDTYRSRARKIGQLDCVPSDGVESGSATRESEVTCVPGCECPDERPIFHNGQCIQVEQCAGTDFTCGNPIASPLNPAVTTKKILGGSTSPDGKWPWMVQVTTNNLVHECGASLISLDWLVTAAHCFVDRTSWTMPKRVDTNLYWFHIGKYWKGKQQDGRRVQVFRGKRIIVHPDYDFEGDRNDIALVQIDGFVHDISHVRPICLPDRQLPARLQTESDFVWAGVHPLPGESCIATGWGTTKDTGPSSDKLKEITLPITKPLSCIEKFQDFRSVICAGGVISTDTCKGDSGGPLACQRDGQWFLDGVTSFGEGCGLGIPGGYARTMNFVLWIRHYVGKRCARSTTAATL